MNLIYFWFSLDFDVWCVFFPFTAANQKTQIFMQNLKNHCDFVKNYFQLIRIKTYECTFLLIIVIICQWFATWLRVGIHSIGIHTAIPDKACEICRLNANFLNGFYEWIPIVKLKAHKILEVFLPEGLQIEILIW